MPLYPAFQVLQQRSLHEHPSPDRLSLGVGHRHAEPKTGRTSPVLHGLPQIEKVYRAHPYVLGHHALQVRASGWVSTAFFRRDDHEAAVRRLEKLAIERICRHRVFHRQLGGGGKHRSKRITERPFQGLTEPFRVHEGELVPQENAAAAHRQDVGVERTGVDPIRMLLRQQRPVGRQSQKTNQGPRRLEGLAPRMTLWRPKGRIQGGPPPREQMDRLTPFNCEARVVGGPLVSERGHRWQRGMHGEMRRVLEDPAQHGVGHVGLERPVRHGM